LQHGSIILKGSFLAPEVRGIVDLAADFSISEFRKKLPSVIAAAVGESFCFRGFLSEEVSLAAEIAKEQIGALAVKTLK
jgi:hypothetical protein